MSKPRGSVLTGWWVWWPEYGDTHARRFASIEDAMAFTPLIEETRHEEKHTLDENLNKTYKKYKVKRPPHGEKWVMRFVWGSEENPAKYGWGHDTPIILSEQDVLDRFISEGEAA